MTIILQPNSTASPGPVTCDSLLTITPNEAYSVQNCPVVSKTRTVIVDKGQQATIRWEMRNRAGQAVNLRNCVDAGGLVFGRILDDIYGCDEVVDIEAAVYDADAGLVDLTLTSELVDQPGIYTLQFGMVNELGQPTFVDRGLLSVERGLFGSNMGDGSGPITIGEIRLQLRDYAISNDLRGVAEMDDTEIVHSILQPIREWNETPPAVAYFTPKTFPFRYHWLIGTCGNLLQISALWYLRNKLQVSHGGVQDDDRNRDQAYMAVSNMLRQQWLGFLQQQKYALNAQLAFGSFT